jgi:hypothetical protein
MNGGTSMAGEASLTAGDGQRKIHREIRDVNEEIA